MKKILALLALVLGVVSCQTEPEGLDVNVGGAQDVTVCVSLPEATRANSAEGAFENVDWNTYTIRYIFQVFYGENQATESDATRQVIYSNEKNVSFPVRLVPNRDYNFVAWADIVPAEGKTKDEIVAYSANDDYHYNTTDLKAIELKGEWNAMDETRDAYTGFYNTADTDKHYSGASQINVNLTRPFAKLRVVTTDVQSLRHLGITPKQVNVTYTVPVYNSFNALSGAVNNTTNEEQAFSFNLSGEEAKNYEDIATTDNLTLFADYLFGAENNVIKFSLKVADQNGTPINKELFSFNTDIPVKRNHLTTIKGNILTEANNVEVVVVENGAFENGSNWNPAEDKYDIVWDGVTISTPSVSENDENIYEIEYPSELAWLAAAVNGTLPEELRPAALATRSGNQYYDFAGKTFRLTRDIDLGGNEWTPIGSAEHPFKGTFNGNNKTIANLFVEGGSAKNQGLFGKTAGSARFENVIIENAIVSGRLNVGALVGEPEGATASNITLCGHVEVNGMSYVGGVAGKHVTADWTNITVDVDETSYVKAHSIENGTAYRSYVGGVVGFMQAHAHTLSNVTSNINVMGSTCDVGGIVGIAHYNNVFVNCKCTGNVEIYAAEEADEAQEIGGIAGVWYNGVDNKKQLVTVTMTNCSFEGNLTTNIEGVAFYYGGLVGKYYDANDATGKLILNGKQYVANAAQLQAAINAATGETTLYLGYDIVSDVTVVQKQGVKITIEGENHKFNGTIKVHSNSNYYADSALTIKNVNFETSTASTNIIEALENGSERYSSNITVENCKFTATGDAVNTSVAVQVKATRGVTVTGCTATNMHSLLQANSCDTGDVKVINSTVDGCKNGVSFTQVKSATVEGTTIIANGYGVRFDGHNDNYGIVVKSNNITANQPFIVRNMYGKDNTITLEGTNTLTTEAEYQIVITNGSDSAEYVKPTGTYTLTGAEGYTMFPAPFPVASWDEFTAALAAGEDWIKLTANISNATSYSIMKDVILDLNQFALEISSPTEKLNIGNKNNASAHKPTVTIKNGKLNCKVYAQTGDVVLTDIKFGGSIAYTNDAQGVISVGSAANLLAERCDMASVKADAPETRPRALSSEGRSGGHLILRDCNFPSSSDGTGQFVKTKLLRTYITPLSNNAKLEITNCKFGVACNIDFSASYVWSNMNLTGCSGGFTFTISRASTSLTEAETAIMKDVKKNNSGTIKADYNDTRVTY